MARPKKTVVSENTPNQNDFRFKVYRREINNKVLVFNTNVEDKEQFASVAQSGSYIITDNGKDVTKTYLPKNTTKKAK